MKKIAPLLILAPVILIVFYALASPTYSLDLVYTDSGEKLLSVPLDKGERFIIHYMHSVDISPVVEVFYLGPDDSLMLEETYFRMFGAGFDHWRGHGTLIKEDGWTKIVEIHKRLTTFVLHVGQKGVDHTLVHRGRSVNLSDLAAGKRVTVSVTRMTRGERLLQELT